MRRPPLGLGALGRQVLHAGMMDTVLNLGLNDQSVEGLAKQTGDERFAFDSYRRFIAMYGRIVLELPGEEFDSLFDAAKELAGTTSDAKVPTELLRYLVDSYQQIVERHTGQPFPRTRRPSCAAPSKPSSGAGTDRGPSPTGTGSASPTTWARRSTCRPWCSATATTTRVPASASPVTRPRAPRALRRLPGQRAGRGRGGGHPQHRAISELKKQFPAVHKELLSIFARLEGHYKDMCDTEFTIDQGKLWIAADPGGQAHRRRGAEDGGGHGARQRPGHLQGRGRVADHRGPPRLGPAPAVLRFGLHRLGQGARRQPGCRSGADLLHGRRRRGGRRPGREGRAGAERDLARGRARHAGLRGILTAAAGWSATPPSWRGAGASRPWWAPRSCASPPIR